ncbi:MAG TPA: RHS repeat-associated core domain-containing protein [Clostridia bacterium]
MVKSYNYDAFGNEKSPDANDTNPFRYCGEYFDKETGTVYLRARYYNPADGRFVSEDSVQGNSVELLPQGFDDEKNPKYKVDDPLSLNLYTYCKNNPINLIDPSGHKDGDLFDSQDSAAADFGKTYELPSADENREYYSYIYKIDKGGKTYYSYSKIAKLSAHGGSPNSILEEQKDKSMPEGVKLWDVVAAIHTHSKFRDYLGDNDLQFSVEVDEAWADSEQLQLYLVNAAGELLVYDPKGYDGRYGQIRLVTKDMPVQSNCNGGTGFHPYNYETHPWYYYIAPWHWGEDSTYVNGRRY